jgi:hypothetical protein
MKKAFNTILKLLLVLAIFLGLQGKVIVRYTEVFNQNHKSEIAHSGKTRVKAAIIHCKLQCYTRHFQSLHPPLASLLRILIVAPVIAGLLYIPFKEDFIAVCPIRLLPLRAPPFSDQPHIFVCL